MNPSVYNSWRLVSLSPLSRAALIGLGLLLLASLAWTVRSVWRERRWPRRGVLIALRTGSALALCALLTEPGLQRLQVARVKSRFVILLDQSRSMGLPAEAAGPKTETRAGAVAAWASAHRDELAALAERFQLEVMGFAGDTQPLDLARLSQPGEPTGSRTDLLGALRNVATAAAPPTRALAGVLAISDGADNVQLERFQSGSREGGAEKDQLAALDTPINTLAVGQNDLKDLAVSALQVDDFAFVRNPLSVEVTLKSQGFGRESVPVTLSRGGRVLASQTVTLDSAGVTHAKLTFTPDQTGEFVFTVAVPVFPGEAVLDNNKRAFVLKVIRDRVRVLLVCGHPSWDERFLRGLLRQDPNVDLVSFFILRDPRDSTHTTREDELSLIPFPTEEIFRGQLHSFDLVILQDFDYRPFTSEHSGLRIETYFPDLKRYVEEGGAMLMIGGAASFGDGQWDQTEIADVLPVSGAGLPPSEELFHPQLTEEGKRHPVTQLAESGEESARLWASLPAVPGVNLVRAKPGARVLLSHPLLSVGGVNAPVLVVADEGRGRSMALMTDSAWHWSFEAAGAGIGNRLYERFFTNAVRWLVRDPDLTPVKLSTSQRSIEPGQAAVFEVRARQADYGPAAGAEIALTVFDAESEKQVAQAHAVAGRDGLAHLEVAALPAGAYRALAVASVAAANGQAAALGQAGQAGQTPGELGRAEQAIAVRASGPETEDPLPHPEVLAKVAKATGGNHALLSEGFPKLNTVRESEEVEVGRRQELPLWDNGWPLAVLAILFGFEWLLRRRWGFR